MRANRWQDMAGGLRASPQPSDGPEVAANTVPAPRGAPGENCGGKWGRGRTQTHPAPGEAPWHPGPASWHSLVPAPGQERLRAASPVAVRGGGGCRGPGSHLLSASPHTPFPRLGAVGVQAPPAHVTWPHSPPWNSGDLGGLWPGLLGPFHIPALRGDWEGAGVPLAAAHNVALSGPAGKHRVCVWGH